MTCCFLLSFIPALSQTFDFESVSGSGTTSLTQTVAGVTLTATRSDGGVMVTSSTGGATGNFLDSQNQVNGTMTLTFNPAINVTAISYWEAGNPTITGGNYILTPSSGTAEVFAENSISAFHKDLTPADWTGITTIIVSYSNSSANYFVGLDQIVFTPAETTINFNSEGWTNGQNLGTSLTRSGFVFSHYNSSLVPAIITGDIFGEGSTLDLYLGGTYFVIKKTDGSEFNFKRMYVVGDYNQTITIAGYRNTKSVVSTSVGTTNFGATVSPSTLDAGFQNVDSVVVSSDLRGGWDSFVFGSPVDLAPPDVKSIVVSGSPAGNSTSINYTVTFYENANNISTGDFQLTPTGGATGVISSVSASSGTSVTVTVNSISGDGTLRLDLKSNTDITDNLGNGNNNNGYADAYTSGALHTSDFTDPTITSVSVPSNSIYVAGQNLNFTINASENVIVNTAGGTPQLSLTIGSTTRQAIYLSGSGTSALVFRYAVQTGDLDTDGIAIGTLSANGGTLKDAAGNDMNTTLNSVGNTSLVLVDAVVPTVSSVSVPANGTYLLGGNLDFTINTNENITISTASGTPQLSLTIGSTSRQAAYLSGSGTSALVFRYAIQPGDEDTDGITTGTLSGNGGTLRDGAGNDLDVTLNNVGSTLLVLVDAIAPVITSFSPASGPVGTSVTISGSHFNATPANNIVYFGATRATVTAATTSQLTVTVPNGSTYAPISVQNSGTYLMAYSVSPFNVTFGTGLGQSITTSSFFTKADFNTNSAPTLSIFDVDMDGKPDLISGNYSSNNMSVLRNTAVPGTISFATKTDFTTGTQPNIPTFGDIDGDGTPDAVMPDWGASTISIYRNTSSSGVASFDARVDFATNINPAFASLRDIDGDGKTDIILGYQSPSLVSVFRNTSSPGAISFDAKVDFATTTVTGSIAVDDIDGDGKSDIVACSWSSATVSVLRNTSAAGAVSFAGKVDFITGPNPFYVSLGDLDGDSKPDLAVTNYSDNTISVLRNTSSAGSFSFASKIDIAVGTSPADISIGDLDGDGKPELVVVNFSSNSVSVLRNKSSSGTLSFDAKVDFTTGTGPGTLKIADLDADGKPDIAVANEGGTTISVFHNELDFTPPVVSSVSVPANGTYGIGQNLDFTINFSENITVNTSGGTPQLSITVGSTTRQAVYTSGTGTSALLFRYTVQSGDLDTDGIAVGSLSANGGTLKDVATNDATLTLNSVGSTTLVLVDAVDPTVSSVSVPSNATYGTGQNLDFTINTSENVTVNISGGTPQLSITVGSNTRQAVYTSGTGTSALLFRYTVQSGDQDADGIAIGTLSANGGTLKDGAGNNMNTILNSVGNTGLVLVATDVTPPSVSSITVSGSPAANASSVTFTVSFDETANNVTTDDFTVTTVSGSADGVVISVSASSGSSVDVTVGSISGTGVLRIILNGFTDITDNAGNGNDTNGSVSVFLAGATHTVDRDPPLVNTITSSTADGTYKMGDVIGLTVNFSEAVTVTGVPQLTLETGTTDRIVNYSSGSGTSVLTFNYTIQPGDVSSDLDYASGGALTLNGGTIKDGADNDPILALVSPGTSGSLGSLTNIIVDGIPPTVSDVSASESDGIYKTGDVIHVTIAFSELVTVTGTPQITLETGTTDRIANFSTGSGTSVLTFDYTVQSGDLSTGLDYTGTGALALNGGTITDAAGNDATLTLTTPGAAGSLSVNKSIGVDGIVPTIVSVIVAPNGTYVSGQYLDFTVNISENVIVSTVGGNPQLSLTIGTATVQATYQSGSGTSALLFRYTVQTGDLDADGISIGTLAENGGALKDGAGNDVNTALNSVASTSSVLVDAMAPTIVSVTVPPNGTYVSGQDLDFTVNASESVIVNTVGGTPQLSLTIGTATVQATYQSGSGTSALLFHYTVQAGDLDADGISVATLAENGGTLKDGAGNDMNTTLNSVGATNSVLVDAVVPVVTSVSVPANGVYSGAQHLDFTINTSENVVVNTTGGIPQLSLTIGTATREAAYQGGSGTSALTFRYTVQPVDLDIDGITVNTLSINGGTLQDGASNSLNTTLINVGNTSLVLVGAVASFSGISDGQKNCSDASAVTLTADYITSGTFSGPGVTDNGDGTATFNPGTAGSGSHTIRYTVLGGMSQQDKTIAIIATPTADVLANVTSCDSYTLPALSVGNYFSGSGGTGTSYNAGDVITSNMTMYVYAESGTTPNCTDENSFTITIITTPVVDTPGDVAVVDSYTLPSLTTGNYFAGPAGTGTMLTAGDVLTSTQTIYIYAAAGNCSDEHSFVVNVNATSPTVAISVAESDPTNTNPIPVTITFSEPVSGFTSSDITVTGGTVNNFNGSDTGYSFDLIPLSDGTLTVSIAALVATDAAGNGNIAAVPLSITYDGTAPDGFTARFADVAVNSLNVHNIRFVIEGGETGASYEYTIGGTGSNTVSGAGTISTSSEGVFVDLSSLSDGIIELTVALSDNAGNRSAPVTDQITKSAGEAKREIPQGFSPNGDGVDDDWVIPGIDQYPNNQVKIFNRYGQVVWETIGYNNSSNAWNSSSNVSGVFGSAGLPDGTYFYVIDFADNKTASRSGFIVIKR